MPIPFLRNPPRPPLPIKHHLSSRKNLLRIITNNSIGPNITGYRPFGIMTHGNAWHPKYSSLLLKAATISQNHFCMHIQMEKLQVAKWLCKPNTFNLSSIIKIMHQAKLLCHFPGTRMNGENNR